VVDVEHVRLAIDVDPPARRITGTASLTASVIAPDTRHVMLDAVELEIASVTAAGKALAFHHDGKQLRVDLGDKRPTGWRTTIDIAYAGAPRRGLYFIHPDDGYPSKPVQVWTQGQDEDSRFWFPCFDAPHEKATTEVVATIPSGMYALSNGVLVSDRTDGGRRTMHWKLDVPHSCYLVTLAVGDFDVVVEKWRDIEVAYLVQRGRADDARRTLGRTPQMLELFSRQFGVDYPYPRYAQVFVADFIFGGMENTSATTLTDVVLLDERAALDHDADALVAHELAHQWFGDLVTCRDWGEGWLNEGFATYAEYLWREHHEGRDAADLELEEWADAYFGEDASRYRRTVAIKLYDEPIDIFDHHLYEKGGRVLHMLRALLGDERLFGTFAHYVRKHRHGVVETRDLARAVEDATGRVVDWFFSQWVIDGAGHPELDVAFAWDPDAGVATATVSQTHKVEGKTPLFRLPTKLRFRVDGEDVDEDVEIVDRQHVFHVALDHEPTQAIFDPGRVLLAQIKIDKAEPLWLAELAGATLAIDRIAAARALGRRGGPKAQAALEAALRGDKFWGVRGAAAAALGTIRNEPARDALVRALADEREPRARARIAAALGGFRPDDRVAAALADLVERGDPSYFVEAAACLALGQTRSSRAPAILRAAARRESWADVIRSSAYKGLAEARDDSALSFLRDGLGWGRPSQGRRAAALAMASLVKGRRDRDARDVRDRLEELLGDHDFRVQAAAIEALAIVGDPAAVPALDRVVDRELDGRLRRRAREVIRDLGEGSAAAEELRRLRDDVDELRSTAHRLRDRLDRLESEPPKKTKKKKKKKKR
jgi:aminopeptidase N